MSILRKPSENTNVGLFGSNGLMRHDGKAGWLTTVLKETHLKMEEKLPDFGWKMGATHLEPVPPLPEPTQSPTNSASSANALVFVLALNSKCRVVLLANAKGMISNVSEYCLFGLLLKTMAVKRVTEMTQNNV